MLINSRGTALSQDRDDVLGALGLGSDQDEPAFVREGCGVGSDHIVGQMIMGKVGLKCADSGQVGFNTAQVIRWNYARRKHRPDRNWTHFARLFRHDSLIVNSAFKSRSS